MTPSLHPQNDTAHPPTSGCLGIDKFVGERGDRNCRVRVYSGPLSRRSLGGRRRRFCLYVEPRYEAAEYLSYRFKPASAVSVLFVRRRFHVSMMTHEVERGERTEGQE
jgi:hypothetical protein